MKTVDLAEQKTAVALTRKEKLLRWADLVSGQERPLLLLHGLEYWELLRLAQPMETIVPPQYLTAFHVAASDPVFQVAGLKGDSVAAAMGFFELSQKQLHEFSCDCGGMIDNKQMGERIARLADPVLSAPPISGMVSMTVLHRLWYSSPRVG